MPLDLQHGRWIIRSLTDKSGGSIETFIVILILATGIGLAIWQNSQQKKRFQKQKQTLFDEATAYVDEIWSKRSLKPIKSHINLKNGEIAFLECECGLLETRSVRYYQSSSVGMRISKRLYVGQTSGVSQSQDELKNIDKGKLTLTNKRLVFTGYSTVRVSNIDKIIDVKLYDNGVEVPTETRQKTLFYTVPNPLIWGLTIKLIYNVSDPLDFSDFQLPDNPDEPTVMTIRTNIEEPTRSNISSELKSLPIAEPQYQSYKYTHSTSFPVYSKISKNFRVACEQLRSSFPAAFQFLSYVENHSDEGFWLGTAVNAHLYFMDSFLAYIKISPESIYFSPVFNGKIAGGTVDRHDLIFYEVFRKLTKSGDGKKYSWAHFEIDGAVIITQSAPEGFFNSLLDEIRQVHKNKNAG
jgi:hypothetical protein